MSSPTRANPRRRRLEGDARPGEPRRRIARDLLIDADLAGLDQRLEPGAESAMRLAPPLGPGSGRAARRRSLRRRRRPADLRAQQAERGRRSSRRLRLALRVARNALSARFALCSRPSRRRGRWRLPPRAARRGGRAPRRSPPHPARAGFVASSPRRIAATWAGCCRSSRQRCGAAVHREPRVSSISSGVPE